MKRGVTLRKTTDKCAALLRYIKAYIKANKYAPSRREMAIHIGASSTSVIDYYLRRLIDGGHIRAAKGIARSIVVLK